MPRRFRFPALSLLSSTTLACLHLACVGPRYLQDARNDPRYYSGDYVYSYYLHRNYLPAAVAVPVAAAVTAAHSPEFYRDPFVSGRCELSDGAALGADSAGISLPCNHTLFNVVDHESKLIAKTRTNAAGEFRFRVPDSGLYRLVPQSGHLELDGHLPAEFGKGSTVFVKLIPARAAKSSSGSRSIAREKAR